MYCCKFSSKSTYEDRYYAHLLLTQTWQFGLFVTRRCQWYFNCCCNEKRYCSLYTEPQRRLNCETLDLSSIEGSIDCDILTVLFFIIVRIQLLSFLCWYKANCLLAFTACPGALVWSATSSLYDASALFKNSAYCHRSFLRNIYWN